MFCGIPWQINRKRMSLGWWKRVCEVKTTRASECCRKNVGCKKNKTRPNLFVQHFMSWTWFSLKFLNKNFILNLYNSFVNDLLSFAIYRLPHMTAVKRILCNRNEDLYFPSCFNLVCGQCPGIWLFFKFYLFYSLIFFCRAWK